MIFKSNDQNPCRILRFSPRGLLCIAAIAATAMLGAAPPAQSPTSPPLLPAVVGWIGNSFSGKDAWVLQDIEDICVTPDGALFTNVNWEEAGGNVQFFKDGEMRAAAGHTHGWGLNGGWAVAANSRYLFIAQQVDSEGGGLKGESWPAKGFVWTGVSRRLRSNIKVGAPFEGGRGKEGDVLPNSFLPIVEYTEGQAGAIRGLAADERTLYVSSPFDNTIKAYDVETMRQKRVWSVDHPEKICLDNQGGLWVVRRPDAYNNRWTAVRIPTEGPDGNRRLLVFPPAVEPTDLCTAPPRSDLSTLPGSVAPPGSLLVADAGPGNQILIYTAKGPEMQLTGSFGEKGGIFAAEALSGYRASRGPARASAAATGRFGDQRFNRPRGIGCDATGSLYIASSGSTAGGSTVLECYSPQGRLRWRRFGLTFVDLPDVTPDGTEVYTKEERFIPGAEAGTGWSYRAYTVNPYKYPDDPRLHIGASTAFVRELNGRRFLFCTDMIADFLAVYRFSPQTDGETAIPCGLFAKSHRPEMHGYPPGQPEAGEWAWIDRNGDGKIQPAEIMTNNRRSTGGVWTVDAKGAIWQINDRSIRMMPMTGLLPSGAPAWDYTRSREIPLPPDLDVGRRLRYIPDRDMLVIGGNRGDDKNQHWKPMGPALCVYGEALSQAPRLLHSVVLPYEKGAHGHESAEPISFDVAGDYIFVAYTRGLKEEGVRNAFVKVLRLTDLSVVGNLSAERDLGETGLLDLVESVRAVRRPNGEYFVMLEDDFRAKVVTFRWKP